MSSDQLWTQLFLSIKRMAELCHRHDQKENKKLPAAERELVRVVKSQPGTTQKQDWDELEAATRQVSLSTVCFTSPWAGRKLLLQKQHLKGSLQPFLKFIIPLVYDRPKLVVKCNPPKSKN